MPNGSAGGLAIATIRRIAPGMEDTGMVAKIQNLFSVRSVFGEPVEKDGALILPVARLRGGGGGGSGEGPRKPAGSDPTGSEATASRTPRANGGGEGLGFGLSAKPVGVFEIKGGAVNFRPAIDVNRIVAGAQIVVAIALVFVLGPLVRARLRA